MAWTMRVVVGVSLVSGIVGVLLATKFYVLQEIFAGLLTVTVLFAVGVLLNRHLRFSTRGLAILPPLGDEREVCEST